MTVQIFVAYDVEHDQDLCERMVASSGVQGVFEVCGRSQKGEMSGPWEHKTQGQIAAADQVVIVCGEHTDASERVAAEFRIAQDQGKPYVLLWSRREIMCTKPAGARTDDTMFSWTSDILQDQLLANERKATPVRVPERMKRQTPTPRPATEPASDGS